MGLDAAVPPTCDEKACLRRSTQQPAQAAHGRARERGRSSPARGGHRRRSGGPEPPSRPSLSCAPRTCGRPPTCSPSERAEDRRAQRARLDAVAARTMHDCDTARHQLEHLQGWQRTIVDGAAWATQLHADLPEHLDACRGGPRCPRRAPGRAADRASRTSSGSSSSARRPPPRSRTPTASWPTWPARAWTRAGCAASSRPPARRCSTPRPRTPPPSAKLEELQLEATGLEVRREAAQPAEPRDDAPASARGRRRSAPPLGELQAVSIPGEVDADASDLAEAWRDLHADLRQVAGPDQGASEARARRRPPSGGGRVVPPLAALDAAASASAHHARRAGRPRRRPHRGAGRRGADHRSPARDRRRPQAPRRRPRRRAGPPRPARLRRLPRRGAQRRPSPRDRSRPPGRRARALRGHPRPRGARAQHPDQPRAAAPALGAGPPARHGHRPPLRRSRATRSKPSSQAHRPAPRRCWRPLADALDAVGIRPSACRSRRPRSPTSTSTRSREPDEAPVELRPDERRIELAAIEARAAALEGELAAAQAEVDRSAEALQLARRSVDAFEGELTVRAGEDVQRMKRFAAAEQLRAQIDAVAAPSAAPRRPLARTSRPRTRPSSPPRAPSSRPPATSATSPAGPASSPRSSRSTTGPRVIPCAPSPSSPRACRRTPRCSSPRSTRPRPRSADAVGAARGGAWPPAGWPTRAATAPSPRTWPTASSEPAARRAPGELLVLDEPFVGVDRRVRADLLEIVRTASADRQLVLLTEDAEVLGWAIELPVEEATAVPADALLTRIRRSNHGLNPTARSGRCHCADRCRSRPPPPTTPPRRMSTSPPPRPSTPTRKLRRPPAAGPVSAEHRRPAVFRTTHIRTKLAFALAVPLARARRGRRLRGRQRPPARSTRPGRRRSSSTARSDRAASSCTSRTSATAPPST